MSPRKALLAVCAILLALVLADCLSVEYREHAKAHTRSKTPAASNVVDVTSVTNTLALIRQQMAATTNAEEQAALQRIERNLLNLAREKVAPTNRIPFATP